MSKEEIINLDYAHLINSKAHLEAFHFSDARAENARLEALFHIQESIRWLDCVRVRMVLNHTDFHLVSSVPVVSPSQALA